MNYCHSFLDQGTEFDVAEMNKLSTEYAQAKKGAIEGTSSKLIQ